MSTFDPKRTLPRICAHVRFVQKAEVSSRSKNESLFDKDSITSSARVRIAGGTEMVERRPETDFERSALLLRNMMPEAHIASHKSLL
jgi:hypothetical protein